MGSIGKGIYTKAVFLMTALSCSVLTAPTFAASASKSINIKLQVVAGCSISVVDMNFGVITQVTGTETASSYVAVICNPGATVLLSFQPTFSVANTTRNSTLTSVAGGKINFSMALRGYFGILGTGQTAYTYIDGKLVATPGAASGIYQSTETLYVIY